MIKSMTGFGRGNKETKENGYIIEIKSVNHRYLDINIKMPRSLISLEDKVRKYLQENLKRGKIDVYFTENTFSKDDVKAFVNTRLSDSYYNCLLELKDRYKLKDEISLALISRYPDVIFTHHNEEDIDKIWGLIFEALKDALKNLIQMRLDEGKKLEENLVIRCSEIKTLLDRVEDRAPILVTEYRTKLRDRLYDLTDTSPIDENRLALELSIFADKASIDEEIVRLNSHIIQLLGTLNEKESIGRKLDFIVQEMNREANTIASKANDIIIINLALNIKNEIEKLREQIQNIE